MLSVAINFGIQFIWFAVLSTIVYNLFLVVTCFRQVKFHFKVNWIVLPCLPFLGQMYIAMLTGRKVNLQGILKLAKTYFGLPITVWFGHNLYYLSDTAEEIRIILNHPKCYNKAQIYDNVQCLFKNALLLLEAEKWKPRRRLLRSAFKTNMLEYFMPTVYQQSWNLIEQIKLLDPNYNIFNFFSKYAFRIFIMTSAGLCEDDITVPEIEKLGEMADRLQDEVLKLLVNPVLPTYIWLKTPLSSTFRKLSKETEDLVNKILLHKKHRHATEYVDNPSEVPLLDILLSDEFEKESESDLYHEIILFGGAATDTTGHTFAFLFTLLGMYPDIQQRVYDEVMSVVDERNIDISNIKNLKYTEAVISEGMRLFPAVPLFGRYCSEDINLETKIIPKGTNFGCIAFYVHRNPEYWKDPMNFDPSRFFPENISKIVPGSYIPFSFGPRNCIGQGVAMMSLKVTVANVIRNFEITSNHKSFDEFILESCISMKTENHLDCIFTPRIKNGHRK